MASLNGKNIATKIISLDEWRMDEQEIADDIPIEDDLDSQEEEI